MVVLTSPEAPDGFDFDLPSVVVYVVTGSAVSAHTDIVLGALHELLQKPGSGESLSDWEQRVSDMAAQESEIMRRINREDLLLAIRGEAPRLLRPLGQPQLTLTPQPAPPSVPITPDSCPRPRHRRILVNPRAGGNPNPRLRLHKTSIGKPCLQSLSHTHQSRTFGIPEHRAK